MAPQMSQSDLRRVARAVAKEKRAHAEVVAAIVAARESGETFRDIARFAGLSHQRVHEIVRDHERGQT